MHINQIANITNEDARTLRIIPWDRTQLKSIENAISSSGLGISVSVDEKGIRVIFPDLTSETRTSLLKIAKTKLEEARISVRTERDKVWSDAQKKKNKEIGEDEKYTIKEKLQKIIDETNKELDLIYEKEKRNRKLKNDSNNFYNNFSYSCISPRVWTFYCCKKIRNKG